jgi:hypothetical protein
VASGRTAVCSKIPAVVNRAIEPTLPEVGHTTSGPLQFAGASSDDRLCSGLGGASSKRWFRGILHSQLDGLGLPVASQVRGDT